MGGSYAFSPIGYSGSYAGFGDTEAARADTAVKYRLNLPNFGVPLASDFRVAGLWQFGGYDQGNGTNGMYQGQIGGDFNLFGGTPFAGALSVDAIGNFARDAVNVGTFSGTCSVLKTGPYKGTVGCSDGVPMFYNNTDVTATLSNNTGLLLTAKYKVASPDGLRRLRMAQADRPEQQLSQWLQDHRRLERARDDPLDFPQREEILADPMDQLHEPTLFPESLPSSGSAPNMRSRLSST